MFQGFQRRKGFQSIRRASSVCPALCSFCAGAWASITGRIEGELLAGACLDLDGQAQGATPDGIYREVSRARALQSWESGPNCASFHPRMMRQCIGCSAKADRNGDRNADRNADRNGDRGTPRRGSNSPSTHRPEERRRREVEHVPRSGAPAHLSLDHQAEASAALYLGVLQVTCTRRRAGQIGQAQGQLTTYLAADFSLFAAQRAAPCLAGRKVLRCDLPQLSGAAWSC